MIIDRYAKFSINIEGISKNLQKYENLKMASFGMRSIHAMCLFQLGKHQDGLTASQLTTLCSVDKALISRILVELYDNRHIEYKEPGSKKYRSKIILTESGKSIVREINIIICETIRKISSTITTEELNVFYKVLLTLNENISELIEIEQME